MAKYGKTWKAHGTLLRYRYSGKYSQWKKKQAKIGGRWVDLDDAWRPTRRGEFRRKYQ